MIYAKNVAVVLFELSYTLLLRIIIYWKIFCIFAVEIN